MSVLKTHVNPAQTLTGIPWAPIGKHKADSEHALRSGCIISLGLCCGILISGCAGPVTATRVTALNQTVANTETTFQSVVDSTNSISAQDYIAEAVAKKNIKLAASPNAVNPKTRATLLTCLDVLSKYTALLVELVNGQDVAALQAQLGKVNDQITTTSSALTSLEKIPDSGISTASINNVKANLTTIAGITSAISQEVVTIYAQNRALYFINKYNDAVTAYCNALQNVLCETANPSGRREYTELLSAATSVRL